MQYQFLWNKALNIFNAYDEKIYILNALMFNNHQRVIDPMIGERQDGLKCISKYRYKWSLKRWSLMDMGT